ncbi:MAG TPA: SpoIIE family protein phosphatase [Polyangiaceae bacterium]|jgi:serine phosphatase RsbU (regulator of sigma subunit)|nr:SpoIIE family protein phosphatase [Polyangiaceae bacterium]
MAKLGVRSFLFLVLGGSAVLPAGLLGLNQARRWERNEVEVTDRQALAAARAAADHVSRTMLGFARASESLARQIAAAPNLELDGVRVALDAHVLPHPEFLGAYVANASGTSLLYYGQDRKFAPGGVSYRDRDYYRELVATHSTAISRVQLGRLTKTTSVHIAAPVLDPSDRLLGFTCTSLDLGQITEQAKTTVKGMADGRVVLLDAEGHIIADSSGGPGAEPRDVSRVGLFRKLASGRAETRVGTDDTGRWVRAAAVGLLTPVPGWRAIAMTPQSTVDAQGRAVRNQTALLACLLILGALGLAGWLASWFARPLRSLAATADTVTRGNFPDSLPAMAPNAPREVAQLTEAVRSMIFKLRENARGLEDLVETRTRELSRTNQELESALSIIREKERSIHEDIEKARWFQERILPALPATPGLDIAVHYAPLAQVSGDIYDVVELRPGHLRVLVADATGHGVQASMRTIYLKSAYDRVKLERADPSTVLARLNEHLVNEFPDGELHSEASCVDLERVPAGLQVSYASAGSTPLFVLSEGAPAREQYLGGPLLGVEHLPWPKPEHFHVAAGETLLICSDGLLEQWNAQRERFDAELVHFRLARNESAQETLARLIAAFQQFRGNEPLADDLTLIAVRVS